MKKLFTGTGGVLVVVLVAVLVVISIYIGVASHREAAADKNMQAQNQFQRQRKLIATMAATSDIAGVADRIGSRKISLKRMAEKEEESL